MIEGTSTSSKSSDTSVVDSKMDHQLVMKSLIEEYMNDPFITTSCFLTSGELSDDFEDFKVPTVSVADVGKIKYPLSLDQCASLVSVSTQAPFGKGEKTVLDLDVRRVWQIDAKSLVIDETWLSESLPELVEKCCLDLGISAIEHNVRANLYKMLLYEEGGHFKKHRDSEKEPGMFGTLLIQLPSEYQGGELSVELNGASQTIDFSEGSHYKSFFTCFYADCEHVLHPVTYGKRLVLAFNLVRDHLSSNHCKVEESSSHKVSRNADMSSMKKKVLLSPPPPRSDFVNQFSVVSDAWGNDLKERAKYALPLKHKYSKANLGFDVLKGQDKTLVEFVTGLRHAETSLPLFNCRIALVVKKEIYTGTERKLGRGEKNEHKRSLFSTRMWVDCDGNMILENFKDLGPSYGVFGTFPDKEGEEDTGNEGIEFKYWYNSAVLVFWPQQKQFDIDLEQNCNDVFEKNFELFKNMSDNDFEKVFEAVIQFQHRVKVKSELFKYLLPLVRNTQQVNIILKMYSIYKTDDDLATKMGNLFERFVGSDILEATLPYFETKSLHYEAYRHIYLFKLLEMKPWVERNVWKSIATKFLKNVFESMTYDFRHFVYRIDDEGGFDDERNDYDEDDDDDEDDRTDNTEKYREHFL